jgi:hypothetical protein
MREITAEMAESDPARSSPEKLGIHRAIPALSGVALILAEGLFILAGITLRSSPSSASGFLLLGRGQKSGSLQGINTFKKEEHENEFELTFGWKDFADRDCQVAFPLLKSALAESEEEFGYTAEELDRHLKAHSEKLKLEMITSLRAYVLDRFTKSLYGRYMLIEDKDSLTFNLKFSVPETVRDAALRDKVKIEFHGIVAGMSQEKDRRLKTMEKELEAQKIAFLEGRGLRVSGNNISVNYGSGVLRNQGRVRPAFEAIQNVRKGANLLDFLSVLLAFVQEIQYGNPPLIEGQKNILGFWVPPRVLAENYGDCDCKGVTFASLWMNLKKYPVLIMRIPDHMLLALAVPSIIPEGTITVRGLRYTLCEVTGPDKLPPGLIMPYSRFCLESGQFQYEMVR